MSLPDASIDHMELVTYRDVVPGDMLDSGLVVSVSPTYSDMGCPMLVLTLLADGVVNSTIVNPASMVLRFAV